MYASREWSPLSTGAFGVLLRRVGIEWTFVELDGSQEVAWPPVCGIYHLQLAKAQTPTQKRFALRHGLGHIMAGHVAHISYQRGPDGWASHEEEVADLFALADLVPDRDFNPDPMVLAHRIALFQPGWSVERVLDRVALRLALR